MPENKHPPSVKPQAKFSEAFPPGHFYSVLPDSATIEKAALRHTQGAPAELPGVFSNADSQLQLLESFAPYAKEFPYPANGAAPADPSSLRYRTKNGMFDVGDAMVLQCFV